MNREPRGARRLLGALRISMAWLLCMICTAGHAAEGPAAPADAPEPIARNPRCQHSANPHRRPRECNDAVFDWDETLAHGFGDLRQNLQQAGVTPTASYVGVLQTNVSGPAQEAWPYAGQLSAAILTDFDKLLGVHGLSFYVGTPITWGEAYLQQNLFGKRLTLQIGRLAANVGFAGLSEFSNYVSSGVNPIPSSLTTNDPAFTGPPPGTEWAVQGTFRAIQALRVVATSPRFQ